MLLHIPGLFSREEVQRIRQALENTDWADGKITAGHQSAKAKHNLQLPEGHPLAKEVGAAMLERLWNNPLFMSAALPHKVFPPLFNCYTAGKSFDFHIDNAVRQARGSHERVRTDLALSVLSRMRWYSSCSTTRRLLSLQSRINRCAQAGNGRRRQSAGR